MMLFGWMHDKKTFGMRSITPIKSRIWSSKTGKITLSFQFSTDIKRFFASYLLMKLACKSSCTGRNPLCGFRLKNSWISPWISNILCSSVLFRSLFKLTWRFLKNRFLLYVDSFITPQKVFDEWSHFFVVLKVSSYESPFFLYSQIQISEVAIINCAFFSHKSSSRTGHQLFQFLLVSNFKKVSPFIFLLPGWENSLAFSRLNFPINSLISA